MTKKCLIFKIFFSLGIILIFSSMIYIYGDEKSGKKEDSESIVVNSFEEFAVELLRLMSMMDLSFNVCIASEIRDPKIRVLWESILLNIEKLDKEGSDYAGARKTVESIERIGRILLKVEEKMVKDGYSVVGIKGVILYNKFFCDVSEDFMEIDTAACRKDEFISMFSESVNKMLNIDNKNANAVEDLHNSPHGTYYLITLKDKRNKSQKPKVRSEFQRFILLYNVSLNGIRHVEQVELKFIYKNHDWIIQE